MDQGKSVQQDFNAKKNKPKRENRGKFKQFKQAFDLFNTGGQGSIYPKNKKQ